MEILSSSLESESRHRLNGTSIVDALQGAGMAYGQLILRFYREYEVNGEGPVVKGESTPPARYQGKELALPLTYKHRTHEEASTLNKGIVEFAYDVLQDIDRNWDDGKRPDFVYVVVHFNCIESLITLNWGETTLHTLTLSVR